MRIVLSSLIICGLLACNSSTTPSFNCGAQATLQTNESFVSLVEEVMNDAGVPKELYRLNSSETQDNIQKIELSGPGVGCDTLLDKWIGLAIEKELHSLTGDLQNEIDSIQFLIDLETDKLGELEMDLRSEFAQDYTPLYEEVTKNYQRLQEEKTIRSIELTGILSPTRVIEPATKR